MRPSLALDPALFTLSALNTSEQQIENAIQTLTELSRRLRCDSEYRILILADTNVCLASAGLYPAMPSICDSLTTFGLIEVYAAEDIRRAIDNILSRALHIESASGINFFVPTSFHVCPDVLANRDGPIRECLQLTLLQTAFLSKSAPQTLVRVLIGDTTANQQINITADLDDIDPPLEDNKNKLTGFQASVWSATTVDDFVHNLCPKALWEHADDDVQIALAIKLAAHRIRQIAGCPNPKLNCTRFTVGKHFFTSLKTWEAAHCGKHASATLDVCARLVAGMPKDAPRRFFKATGAKNKTENGVRISDKAEAWRTHITKNREGMRLMYWQKSDKSIEFAYVGSKFGTLSLKQ